MTSLLRIVLVMLLPLLVGCFEVGYVAQAAAGQDELSYRARPIADVIADPTTPDRTARMLELVGDVKAYGEAHELKATSNYEDFVQLDGPAVVWVVSAAHPLRFESKTWWFPIVGEVPYLGWFALEDAKRMARQLKEEGWDVHLRGASAYSTLGFFADPILSSMIKPRASVVGDLVNVVLHESVHATYYVTSQTLFNESLADFVADELTLPYLEERLLLDRWQIHAYRDAQIQRERRSKRLFEAWRALDMTYRTPTLTDAEKLWVKYRIMTTTGRELGYGKLNNAILAQSRAYHGGIPVFGRLFEHCGRDWERFWRAIRTVGADAFSTTQEQNIEPVIERLLGRDC